MAPDVGEEPCPLVADLLAGAVEAAVAVVDAGGVAAAGREGTKSIQVPFKK